MGTVYLAAQETPVRRQVALKVIKPGLDSAPILARFEAERQALALMDHPHIARVFDAGTAADGRPYFVMELVQGVPLTRYCDQARLSPRARLELFLPVCQAVQHAHQKGVIHRDLKPSNVLVAQYDGEPVPKVIDFGLAKAVGHKLTDQSACTQVGTLLGTLEYMAPEQAELTNPDIDTRADVYALGVLLYELLTGTPPFTAQQLGNAPFTDLLWLIREAEPARPSVRLAAAPDLSALATARGMEPKGLTKLVRGELDWVVMKCLEKDRNRRYETANALARDVQRYLAGEPVLAVPPSASYRLRKFARKHGAALATAAALTGLLVSGVAVSSWQAVRATRAQQAEAERAEGEKKAKEEAQQERDAKERARQEEEQERRYAQAIAGFVRDDFFALTSVEGQERFGGTTAVPLDKDTTLRQLLDRAAEKLNRRTDLDPRTEAELRWMIGVNYRGLGEAGLGIPFLERCVVLRKEWFGPDHDQTLNAQNSLAVCYDAAGQLDLALPLYVETLKLQKAKLGTDHPDTLRSLSNLALGYRAAGQLDRALPLLEETLRLRKAKLGADHPETLTSMNNLALGYRDAGNLDRALPLLQDAAAGIEKLRFQHQYAGGIVSNLIGFHERLKQFDQAEAWRRKWLAVVKERFGPDSVPYAGELATLGWNLLQQRKWTAAEAVLRDCLAIREQKQPDAWSTFNTRSLLGSALLGRKQYADAEPLLLQGYEGLKQREAQILPAMRPRLADALERLVQLYDALDKPEKAAEWRKKLEQAKAAQEKPKP
jgi:tRNA A-37 threonylcarbamoyl transferase component Bud32